MGRKKNRKKNRMSPDAEMAKRLLPPTPNFCPPYSVAYFERFASRLFSACYRSRHKLCPKTVVERGVGKHDHFYCKCPCHRTDLKRHQARKLFLQYKAEHEASQRPVRKQPRVHGEPKAPRTTAAKSTGARGAAKKFRFLKALHPVPAGIMAIVHGAIKELKEATVSDVATQAITDGLTKVTGQDPTTQTSIMLHRLLKAGCVEVKV